MPAIADYSAMLLHSYEKVREIDIGAGCCPPDSRLEFLCDDLFGLVTYDGDKSALFGRWAVTVCRAITERTTFELIRDEQEYARYLLLCNLPFFDQRIEYGTSIRGAWWDGDQPPLDSCGLWWAGKPLWKLKFTQEEWTAFMRAVVAFAEPEMVAEEVQA